MRENLVPEKRADKNGHLTTRWVKPDSSVPSAGTVLPAPSLNSVTEATVPLVERPFIPTKKQTRQQWFLLTVKDIDRRLPEQSKSYGERYSLSFKATDLEVFEILSVTRDNNTALVLLNEGIKSADDAVAYLKGISAEPLLDDRSELADKLRERRTGAQDFFELSKYYNPALWHSGEHLDRYLDAVEAMSHPKLRHKSGTFFSDILNGKINYSDVKTIGLRTCSRILLRGDDLSLFHGLAEGTTNYTAEQLHEAFKTADGNYYSYDEIILMSKRHGGDWATGIDWRIGVLAMRAAHSVDRSDPNFSEMRKGFVEYADQFMKHADRDMKSLYEIYKAGVDLDFAVEKSADPQAYNAEQLIAMQEGVPVPMTQGWL